MDSSWWRWYLVWISATHNFESFSSPTHPYYFFSPPVGHWKWFAWGWRTARKRNKRWRHLKLFSSVSRSDALTVHFRKRRPLTSIFLIINIIHIFLTSDPLFSSWIFIFKSDAELLDDPHTTHHSREGPSYFWARFQLKREFSLLTSDGEWVYVCLHQFFFSPPDDDHHPPPRNSRRLTRRNNSRRTFVRNKKKKNEKEKRRRSCRRRRTDYFSSGPSLRLLLELFIARTVQEKRRD